MKTSNNPDDLRLVVGNRNIEGWTSVQVTRGIERCPNEFSLGLTERYPGETSHVMVRPGDTCKVYLGADLAITGYVNRTDLSIAGKAHTITVSGRGKCQDLVDAASKWPGNQFSNVSVLTIAQGLAKAFGISVTALAEPKDIIPQLNISRGETSFEIIERVCRYTALLAYEGTNGNLVLANVGKGKHSSGLHQGINVQEASAMFSDDTQFSEYAVYSDSFNRMLEVGDAGFLVTTVSNRDNVRRYRAMDIIGGLGDPGSVLAEKRAAWERNRRYGHSNVVHVTTDSWRDKAGNLYEPNKLIEVDIPSLKISKRTWLIGEVTYRRDASGTACDLTIMPPEAFSPQPIDLYPFLKEAVPGPGSTAPFDRVRGGL